ncbi:MAG TPA: tRNA (N6-isopentenyl adenosine(37)-C2)-methylthiotransferase MiaB [Candidatus Acidoferrales bacterium]|jgi:tRNA-2-methylthio-N6-dimethylallyladenosine synthase|nr:tRNA (N6-isopentenyl adenosine(37)-C2)-methylthiotransferase MiaB [Candidatus Acidoferrales bacterium]
MADVIDVRLESLTAGYALAEPLPAVPPSEIPSGKAFYLETFGCQMNAHDSEKVAGVLFERGYHQVETPQAAGLVLYNTCSIREKAAQKVFSRLGEFRGPAGWNKIIGVLGCVAQQEGEEIFERAPWVSLVCGSASYRRLPQLLSELEAGGRRVTGLDLDTDETFETEFTRRDNPFRAYITIIEGCDYACSYCVVPHTRGPERSRRSAAVLEEVRRLADLGYTEVQLLGQTVNSYRDPSPGGPGFAELLRAVADVPGIRRVRFTTSHPNDFGREIVEAIEATPVLCNHVHLPVQSGSTRVLRAMRRTYTRDEYLEKIALIRAARRPISITSDVIVGFPGETEADFAETLALLDLVGYDGVFAFTYSPRPNTDAREMPDAVPEEEKGRRLAALLERQRQIQIARNQILVGQTFEVLVDARHESKAQWAGRTTSNRIVNCSSPRNALLGEYIQVKISRAAPNSLIGEQV